MSERPQPHSGRPRSGDASRASSRVRLTTPLCSLLDLEHPIISAPMAGHAGVELAAAVSSAGALGMIGVDPGIEPNELRSGIRHVRDRTDRPFGVGFITSFPDVDRLVAVAIDERVPVISHSFGDPTPYVAAARAVGIRTIAQIQKVGHARRALAASVDVLVAQGVAAGGHTGQVGTLPLGLSVIDIAGATPVVLAGGFADGRGLAAALLLGAGGVWMGTRFVASEEALQPRWMKEQVITASSDDTVLTKVYDLVNRTPFPTDVGDRVLRNAFTEKWHGHEDELVTDAAAVLDELRNTAPEREADTIANRAGGAVGQVRSIESASTIVTSIVDEAATVLRTRPPTVLA